MHAVLAPAIWDNDQAVETVVDTIADQVGANHSRDVLAQKSLTMVNAFHDGLQRQGLTVDDVRDGQRVNVEWLAAEISVQADWRGLPSNAYDYDDARSVARRLLSLVRAASQSVDVAA